jgi:hypothetical protein
MDSITNNFCPVCGYILSFAPWEDTSSSDEICPCCGIQFGYDDAAGGDINKRHLIYKEWRKCWIEEGMPWKGKGIPQSSNWNPFEQLRKFEKK